jgi:hypothetical protein
MHAPNSPLNAQLLIPLENAFNVSLDSLPKMVCVYSPKLVLPLSMSMPKETAKKVMSPTVLLTAHQTVNVLLASQVLLSTQDSIVSQVQSPAQQAHPPQNLLSLVEIASKATSTVLMFVQTVSVQAATQVTTKTKENVS